MSYECLGALLIRLADPDFYDMAISTFCHANSLGRDVQSKWGSAMLKYAIIFAVISLVAGAFGFGGIAAGSAGIAKILFGLFLILAVVFIVLAALGVGAARNALK